MADDRSLPDPDAPLDVPGEAPPAVAGRVSLYVPTRNRVGLLRRAVETALAQRCEDFEVLVVDDGSSDGTQAFLARAAARCGNLRPLRLETSRGASAARNLALRNATGEFVTGLDDDDGLAPDHLERLRAAYRPEFAFVASSRMEIRTGRRVPNRLDAGTITLSSLLHYNKVGNQAFMERDRVLAIGGYDESLPAFQDYDLFVRLVARYGPARKTLDATYEVDSEHGLGRISSSVARRREGLARFVEKHRDRMSPAHLRSMELLDRRLDDRPFGLKDVFRYGRRGNLKSVVSAWVNCNLPWVQDAYRSFRERRG